MIFEKYLESFLNNDSIDEKERTKYFSYFNKYAPKLICPDKIIEETFAFRSYVYMKHIKETPEGFVVTEFLNDVPWAGKYNTINAPLFHHINEGRWFSSSSEFLLSYIDFFLKEIGDAYQYSTPALKEIIDYLFITNNFEYLKKNINLLENYFKKFEQKHILKNKLYFSYDNYDAMEFSISGTDTSLKMLKGIRPTLNSYMYGGAIALARAFKYLKDFKKQNEYLNKARAIKENFNKICYDTDFYKALHSENLDDVNSINDVKEELNVKELIGYIPFEYGLADENNLDAYKYLKNKRIFNARTGFTTADMSNPRFLYKVNHECLWNGYVWPYATSQTISSMIEVKNIYNSAIVDDKFLYNTIKKYAKMHYMRKGIKKISFIDESMLPNKYVWISRKILQKNKNSELKGGSDRGKDYNHSTFIDLVIRGLIGIDPNSETLLVKPRIYGVWKYFKLTNILFKGKKYEIQYDETGKFFGEQGLKIQLIN